jgi:hypothetical protein
VRLGSARVRSPGRGAAGGVHVEGSRRCARLVCTKIGCWIGWKVIPLEKFGILLVTGGDPPMRSNSSYFSLVLSIFKF